MNRGIRARSRSPTYAEWPHPVFQITSSLAQPLDDADADGMETFRIRVQRPSSAATESYRARCGGTRRAFCPPPHVATNLRVEVSTDLLSWRYNATEVAAWTNESSVRSLTRRGFRTVVPAGALDGIPQAFSVSPSHQRKCSGAANRANGPLKDSPEQSEERASPWVQTQIRVLSRGRGANSSTPDIQFIRSVQPYEEHAL